MHENNDHGSKTDNSGKLIVYNNEKNYTSTSTSKNLTPLNMEVINHPIIHQLSNPDLSTMEDDTLSTISHDVQSVNPSKKRVKRSKSMTGESFRVISNCSPSGSALVNQFFNTQREQLKRYSSGYKTRPLVNAAVVGPSIHSMLRTPTRKTSPNSAFRIVSAEPTLRVVGSAKRNSAQELIHTPPRASSRTRSVSRGSLNLTTIEGQFYATPRSPFIPKSTSRVGQQASSPRDLRQYQYSLKSQPMDDVYVASLLSQQDEMYGTNMLENITLEDILYIQFQMSEGVLEIEALLNVFERKVNGSSDNTSGANTNIIAASPGEQVIAEKYQSAGVMKSQPNSIARSKSQSSIKKDTPSSSSPKDIHRALGKVHTSGDVEPQQAIEFNDAMLNSKPKEKARPKSDSHAGQPLIKRTDKADPADEFRKGPIDAIPCGAIATAPGSIAASKKTRSPIVYANPVVDDTHDGSDSDDSFQFADKVHYTVGTYCTKMDAIGTYCTEIDAIKIAECLSSDNASYDRRIESTRSDFYSAVSTGAPHNTITAHPPPNTITDERHMDYDFCLVFASEHNDLTADGKACLDVLIHELRCQVSAYRGRGLRQHIFVLVKVPVDVYKRFAELIRYRLLLDKVTVREYLERGDKDKGISRAVIPHDVTLTEFQPWECIYGRYTIRVDDCLYWRAEGDEHPFNEAVRLKLTLSLLQSRAGHKGGINIDKLVKEGTLFGFFPFHHEEKRYGLFYKLIWFPITTLPVVELREYAGEKVAMFYCFIEHCIGKSLVPSMVGLAIEICVLSSGNFNSMVLPFYGLFSMLWIMFQLRSWRSREQMLALQWGTLTINADRYEEDRPGFYGDVVQSYIDGTSILYYPQRKQDELIYASIYRMVALVVLVIGLVACIYATRARLQGVVGGSASQGVAAAWNALQTVFLNYIIRHVSDILTDRENHRTDALVEDGAIKKMFLLQSINSYASLLYIAFIAIYVDECPKDGCMSVLALHVLVVFLTSIASAVFEVVLYSWSLYHRKVDYYDIFSDNTPSAPEREHLLLPYRYSNSSDSILVHKYARLSVLFGYMVLFATALPSGALLFAIALLVELHVDARRLLLWFQRPFHRAAEDIGSWSAVFWTLSIASIVTNAAIMAFTMNSFDHLHDSVRYWMFILFQWIGLMILWRLKEGDPINLNHRSSNGRNCSCSNGETPTAVAIQVSRTAFIIRQLIDQVGDDLIWSHNDTNNTTTASGHMKDNTTVTITIHDSFDGLHMPLSSSFDTTMVRRDNSNNII